MKKNILNFLLMFTLISFSQVSWAKSVQKNNNTKITPVFQFSEARFFIPLQGAKATAGYANIKNLTQKEITLKFLSAENFLTAESHETKEVNGLMKMSKVENFKILPQETLSLKPGGAHLMLFDPQNSFTVGDEIIFTFEINGKLHTQLFKAQERTTSMSTTKDENKKSEHQHH